MDIRSRGIENVFFFVRLCGNGRQLLLLRPEEHVERSQTTNAHAG